MSKTLKELGALKKLEEQLKDFLKATRTEKDEAKAKEFQTIIEGENFYAGRMLSGSKSYYSTSHPKSVAIFNANMVVKSCGKIWYGDLDITRDGKKLKELAKKCGEPIYILREMDCRFDKENDPIKELIKRAVWNTDMEVINYDEYKKSLGY